MPSLDTLDTVIAIVVVLLVLSLMVQAIQSFIKKIFKLKSKEIEKSLADLFEHVIDKAAANAQATTPAVVDAKPDSLKSASRELVDTVLNEFKKVGRYTKRGRLVLDSISKEDLLKILARVDSRHFYADYVTKFQAMYTDIEALEREITRLINNDPPLLQGAASARFAEMQAVLSPLINDVRNIISGNTVKPDVLFGDLITLRRVKLDDALQLLASAQDSIASDLKEARAANNPATAATLQQLSVSLASIAGIVGQLSQRMDAAFAMLRAKLDHVEMWYDTVMQSFEERYTRQMKNVALYISICVVVYLNASFFRIYSNIATNDLQRALILQEGQDLSEELQQSAAAIAASASNRNNAAANPAGTTNSDSGGRANSNTGATINASANATGNPNTNANTSDSASINADNNANSGDTNTSDRSALNPSSPETPASAPSPSPSTDEPPVTTAELNDQREVIENYVDTYERFGFSPLTWEQVKTWTSRLFLSTPRLNDDGEPLNKANQIIPANCPPNADCDQAYDKITGREWMSDRRHDFSTILGWAVMVLLLSVGAPFWQDTLESLFGVKNLLRKKSDTKNVEKESGAGQTRQ